MCICLLGKGSDDILLQVFLDRGYKLQADTSKPSAANGSNIPIFRSVILKPHLNEKPIVIEALVTEDADEFILGLDWLKNNASPLRCK